MNLPAHRADLTMASPAQGIRVLGYDYERLEAAHVDLARQAAERIRGRLKTTTLAAIETGRDLLAMKELLGPGAYGEWREAEFGMSERTAQHYMLAASEFGDSAATVSVLPPATVYALAAPSTPKTIRAAVLRQIEEGQRPEPAAIINTISEAKQAERDRRDAERKAAKRAKLTPEEQAEQVRKYGRSQKDRERREAKQQAKAAEDRKRVENAAEEVAGLIAVRLFGDEFGQVLAHAREWDVWYRVRDLLMTRGEQLREPETTPVRRVYVSNGGQPEPGPATVVAVRAP